MTANDQYREIFDIEIEGWCYGLQSFSGEIFPGLVHRVIKEMEPIFLEAVRRSLVFDLVQISKKFSKAAKYLVGDREIAFSILAHLPNPRVLDEDGQYVVAAIVDQAEQVYGGALARLQRRWAQDTRRAA